MFITSAPAFPSKRHSRPGAQQSFVTQPLFQGSSITRFPGTSTPSSSWILFHASCVFWHFLAQGDISLLTLVRTNSPKNGKGSDPMGSGRVQKWFPAAELDRAWIA